LNSEVQIKAAYFGKKRKHQENHLEANGEKEFRPTESHNAVHTILRLELRDRCDFAN